MTVRSLWRQFLPLSLSDVTMAFGDPAITTTLAHLPFATINLAAVGVAKAISVFFESPIIMLLHASNSLGVTKRSREALWRFTLLSMAVLTTLLAVLSSGFVFPCFARVILGITPDLAEKTSRVLTVLSLWPAMIAWRRFYQGLLIRYGHGGVIAKAGVGRLVVVVGILAGGYALKIEGSFLAAISLVGGIFAEALFATVAAKQLKLELAPDQMKSDNLPGNIKSVWGFYWPLANSMLVVWGGRAVLITLIARAMDGPVAIAVWSAAWGLILLVGNSTRMVQQVIIKNHERASAWTLLKFTFTVGAAASLVLIGLGSTSIGLRFVELFLGRDLVLVNGVIPVLIVCSSIPFLIACQNAAQGFLISSSRTSLVNYSTWVSTMVLLGATAILIKWGYSGSLAAAIGMLGALVAETAALVLSCLFKREGSPALLHKVS